MTGGNCPLANRRFFQQITQGEKTDAARYCPVKKFGKHRTAGYSLDLGMDGQNI
jgi:hypothetical protein